MGELVGTVCAVLLSRQNVGPLVSRRTQTVSPKWRSGVTAFGFSACTVSLVTTLLLMLYANVSSSLTPYHPISVLAYRTIFVTSLLAIVAGIVGKGPLETPTFVCSVLCLLVLAIAGFAS
jgi:hypothetical protein